MKGESSDDERPQWKYITKEELSSPTISLYVRPYWIMHNRHNGQKESNNHQYTWCISMRIFATRQIPWIHHVQRGHGLYDMQNQSIVP